MTFIIVSIITFSFVMLYLDNWYYSKNNYIRFIQIISPILFICLIYYNWLNLSNDLISYMSDNKNNKLENTNSVTVTVSDSSVKSLSEAITKVGDGISNLYNNGGAG